jgi:hypothetical protein
MHKMHHAPNLGILSTTTNNYHLEDIGFDPQKADTAAHPPTLSTNTWPSASSPIHGLTHAAGGSVHHAYIFDSCTILHNPHHPPSFETPHNHNKSLPLSGNWLRSAKSRHSRPSADSTYQQLAVAVSSPIHDFTNLAMVPALLFM